ncbi:Uncharacterised protein [Bordetella pertussis]|nr:Uncharacterised protein [Bordetella pertussis]CFU10031.1 Uncharacterised protein [Bordetella pertussis]CPP22289.1 Uncharacterised protein [Bordetella pertussis]
MPRGAYSANHAVTSKPATPASAKVGRSGTEGSRCAEVMAMPRTSEPSLICASAPGRLSNRRSTCPPATAGREAEVPLNGTCSRLIPATASK